MDFTDKAAHTALTKILPEFTNSNISPENLADNLQARGIIGKAACEAARNKLKLASDRRRDLLNDVMGCGKNGAFQDLVDILLEMCESEWFGKKLIAAYVKEGGVDIWTKKAHHTPVSELLDQEKDIQPNGKACAEFIPISSTGILQERPTEKLIILINYIEKSENKRFRLIDSVATEWENVGKFLNFSNGQITNFKKCHPGDVKAAATAMLTSWLRSDTKATWEKLMKALKDASDDLAVDAETFEYALLHQIQN